MFDIKVTNEQYYFAKDLVSNYNFGQRGVSGKIKGMNFGKQKRTFFP